MADIIPNVVVSMPSQLFTLARSFKAAANGSIYVGAVDTDPLIPANQIQVYVANEDGTFTAVAQPIKINAGGYPVYEGQVAKFVTVEGQSMTVLDSFGVQQFYFPKLLEYSADQFRQELASNEPGQGASLIGTESGLNVQESLSLIQETISLGRIVYPEMYAGSLLSPTDDDLFSAMFSALAALPDTSLSNDLPYTIDLKGKVYTLNQTHSLDINFNIINGTLLMNGGQIVMGNEATDSKTRRHILKDLKVRYIGASYFPDALVKMARSYNSFAISCDFWAGISTTLETTGTYIGKPQRARYGLWMGSKRAWGCGIVAGEYYGGEIACRIGFTNDHTGITVTGGATFHHGWVGNLLMCNPAGFLVAGVNIEHSENGAWGLCITSGTNAALGVVNAAHGGDISGVYFYNNGNGTDGATNAPAAVIIGYDAPGTTDFDVVGALITSQNTAHSITVKNSYIVSPKQDFAVKMRGLAGLKVLDNKYTYNTGSYGFIFEGTGARSDCVDNRNQSTGLFDEIEYTSTSKPRVGTRLGTFLPVLVGGTIAGSLSYSTRGGDYSISNGMCVLSLWLSVGSVTTQPTGNLTIDLPVAITSGRRSGCGVFALALVAGNNAFPLTANITNGTTLNIFLSGSPMQGSVIQATTDMRLSISYPIDGAVYTGV